MQQMTPWLALMALCLPLGCAAPTQQISARSAAVAKRAESDAPAAKRSAASAAECPAGQARVRRGEGTKLVPTAEAFSGAMSGDAITLCPGRAVVDKTLKLFKVNNVTIEGKGTSLVAPGDFAVVNLSECTNVTLQGVHVVHEIGKWCSQGCVEVSNSQKVTIRNARLDGSGYFGVVLWKVRESTFEHNLFHNCHYGFSSTNSSGITLKSNTFRDNRGANIYASTPKTFVNDVKADNALGVVGAGKTR